MTAPPKEPVVDPDRLRAIRRVLVGRYLRIAADYAEKAADGEPNPTAKNDTLITAREARALAGPFPDDVPTPTNVVAAPGSDTPAPSPTVAVGDGNAAPKKPAKRREPEDAIGPAGRTYRGG
jgi:hypothetical protein